MYQTTRDRYMCTSAKLAGAQKRSLQSGASKRKGRVRVSRRTQFSTERGRGGEGRGGEGREGGGGEEEEGRRNGRSSIKSVYLDGLR